MRTTREQKIRANATDPLIKKCRYIKSIVLEYNNIILMDQYSSVSIQGEADLTMALAEFISNFGIIIEI